jgi:hypothetical protein
MQPGLSEQKFARHSRPMIWMPSGSMRNSIFAACRIGSSAALSPASSILRSAFPVWDGAMPQASKSNEEDAMFNMLSANRRDLLIAPLLATLPGALLRDGADASPIDPNMTLTKLPDQIIWEAARNRPPNTVEQALLWGKSSEPGLYYYLVKWYPGFMSAPLTSGSICSCRIVRPQRSAALAE